MEESSLCTEVVLGPVKPAFRPIYLLAPVVLFVAAALLGRASYGELRAEPSSTKLRCARTAETVHCEEVQTWVRHPDWGTRTLRTFDGATSEVHLEHVTGSSPKDCFAVGQQLVCDGDVRHDVDAVRALGPGQSVELDGAPPPSMQKLTLMAAGALLLVTLAVLLTGNALGRSTRVLLKVYPAYLEVDTRWAGFWRRPLRRVSRVGADEKVRVVLTSPRRGSMPVWRIEYGKGEAFEPLLEVVSFAGPEELEEHAERARKSLASG